VGVQIIVSKQPLEEGRRGKCWRRCGRNRFNKLDQ